jgi:hypothetical protein
MRHLPSTDTPTMAEEISMMSKPSSFDSSRYCRRPPTSIANLRLAMLGPRRRKP